MVLAVVLARVRGGSRRRRPSKPAAEPFEITDNSFLVEEAFNQEAGIFQNIFNAVRNDGDLGRRPSRRSGRSSRRRTSSRTRSRWRRRRHGSALGDTLLNYRYQALIEGPGRPAFSPRLSLILPTGNVDDGRGAGSAGLQFNLPFSKQTGDVYWHWNGGLTWLPRAEPAASRQRQSLDVAVPRRQRHLRLRPMFHRCSKACCCSTSRSSSPGTTSRDTTLHAVARSSRRMGSRRSAADPGSRAADHLGRRRTRDRRVPLPVLRAAVQEVTAVSPL